MVRVSQPGLRPHRATHETGGSDQLTDLTLSKLKMTGDIDLGNNKLKTTNLLIKEVSPDAFGIRDVDDSRYYNLKVNTLGIFDKINTGTGSFEIQSIDDVNGRLLLQSYSGTAFINNLKLMGGFVKAYNLISMGGYGNFAWDGDDIIFGPKVKLDDPDCNLALSGSASDFGAGLNPENAIDGDPATYAGPYATDSGSYVDVWLLDLGAVESSVKIAIKFVLDQSFGSLKVLVSEDNSTWTTGKEYYQPGTSVQRDVFEASDVRYIKIQLQSNGTTTTNLNLYEVVVIKA